MKKNYSIGLDIGTASIGYSVVDDNGQLVRVKGTKGIGVRLYNEADKAEERRGFRTTRRRISRRRWRMKFLREFFDKPMAEVDPGFFQRLKYYNESPKDTQIHGVGKYLFDNKSNIEFGREYPTIYHLRRALMTEKRQFDIREIYMAISHIVKFRGHFLDNSPVTEFKRQVVNYDEIVADLAANYKIILADDSFSFPEARGKQLKEMLLKQDVRPSDRAKQLAEFFTVDPTINGESARDIKELKARNKRIGTELGKALSGLSTSFDEVLQIPVEKEVKSEWKMSIDNVDELLNAHGSDIETEAQYDVIESLRTTYSNAYLTGAMPNGISASMIQLYEDHERDLAEYKALARRQSQDLRNKLMGFYSEYIEGKDSKAIPQDVFYDNVKKAVAKLDDADAVDIINKIELGKFMPKPRSKANAMIAHQSQQLELDAIIDNQKQYYSWLGEVNPVEKHLANQPYKLDELVSFRNKYYVGPMITAEDQKRQSGASFAWMVRKEPGAITPWNFDQKVDKNQSATNFIERMKTTDTYLMGANVLPASSLIYQEFAVLNELNNVRVNKQHLTTDQKQKLIRDHFKRQGTVSKKDLANMIVGEGLVPTVEMVEIDGMADLRNFNSHMSTWRDLNKIIPNALTDETKADDIERIIEWSTLFEDKIIFRSKLGEIDWLTSDQQDRLSAKRYRGWGKLSAELLTGIKRLDGQTIMDVLRSTTDNFMQIVNKPEFAQQIEVQNNDDYSVKDIIADAYTSPSNRKALRQVVAVVEDIQRAMGSAPQYVYIEAADGPAKNPSRTQQRANALLETYEKNADVLSQEVYKELKDKIRDKADFKARLVLYFMQNGRDAYTGKTININQLSSSYDIDHIIPQSYVKDNSFDNRVLTSKDENERRKEAGFAADYAPQMIPTWKAWHRAGIISEKKLKNLLTNEKTFSTRVGGFIARQLVETRQIIKLTQQVLTSILPEDSRIISIKADMTHEFRSSFDFPKSRDANDYHHAFDAYLTSFIGTYLRRQYPKLKGLFEYGDYLAVKKGTFHKANFIYDLVHQAKRANDDGVLTWSKDADLAEMNRIYEYKTMHVAYETYEYHGALNDQTRYKASDASANGGSKSKMIPAANDRPVEIYGGFTGSKISYLAIARFEKKGEPVFRVVPVYVRDAARLKAARKISKAAEIELLTTIAAPLFEKTSKAGKVTKTPFRVVLPHVQLGTIFENSERGKFRLVSHTEYRNTVQLWLSKAEISMLTVPKTPAGWKRYYEPSRESLMELFDNIVERESKSNKLMSLKIKGLEKIRPNFEKLAIQNSTDGNKEVLGMVGTLRQMTAALHANANSENLKAVGGPSDFGRVFNPSGLDVPYDTFIFNESASGLFINQISLKDL